MRSVLKVFIFLKAVVLTAVPAYSVIPDEFINIDPPSIDLELLNEALIEQGLSPVDSTDPTLSGILSQFISETEVLAPFAAAMLEKYKKTPKLAFGFANANAYSAHAASQRFNPSGKIVISAGMLLAAHAPSTDLNYYTSIQKELDEGDIEAGAALNPFTLRLSMDSGFILDNSRLGIVAGRSKLKINSKDLNLMSDSMTLGVLGSYQLLKSRSAAGLIGWGGVTVLTGVIYQSSDIRLYKELDTINSNLLITYPALGYSGYVMVDPSVYFRARTSAVVFPAELLTSFNIIGFNAALGAGLDFVSGSSTVELGGAGSAFVDGNLGRISIPGEVRLDSKTRGGSPEAVRARLSAALGFSIGPFMLDIPLTWHISSGASVGLTSSMSF